MTTKIRKLKEKSLSTLIHDLDGVFSRFIRYRDMENGRIPCFICGAKMSFQEAQCGHYVDRDQMPTRYDEMNCHAVCEECNCFDPDHKLRYHTMLTLLYGFGAPESLEAKAKGLQKYMRHEIEDLIEHYTRESDNLKRLKGL